MSYWTESFFQLHLLHRRNGDVSRFELHNDDRMNTTGSQLIRAYQ